MSIEKDLQEEERRRRRNKRRGGGRERGEAMEEDFPGKEEEDSEEEDEEEDGQKGSRHRPPSGAAGGGDGGGGGGGWGMGDSRSSEQLSGGRHQRNGMWSFPDVGSVMRGFRTGKWLGEKRTRFEGMRGFTDWGQSCHPRTFSPPSAPSLRPLLLFFSLFLLSLSLHSSTPPLRGRPQRHQPVQRQLLERGRVRGRRRPAVWNPLNPSVGDKVARAIVYFVALVYMFLGMSIIADRFMSSIEVITSQEKEITIKRPNGETTTATVRIWNETVSNLTLMALGSSAPEILLSVIEVCGHGFESGALGPSTIVGSAAFNMFVIIGLCVYVVPDGETRKVKHLRVFFVTAAWSIFAYIWLYLILCVFSPGEVEVWEAVLTFLYFPLCVVQVR
ncbi:hypothetical protein ACEWY4_025240 [Coilia grayii]|uniref:Sodium/calcium exchanger membrane region domain-containing protein n=1 Tax=Coilia grayii TaxID=363190 RepID=A0ABD1IX07_9TELE